MAGARGREQQVCMLRAELDLGVNEFYGAGEKSVPCVWWYWF